jgi:RNase P subunit RPR2
MSKPKENLVCEMCSKHWVRKVARGRKPRFCPECIEENVVVFEQGVTMSSQESKKSRLATRWTCPNCGEGITVFVNLEYPPICRNAARHSTKGVEMQKGVRKQEVFA